MGRRRAIAAAAAVAAAALTGCGGGSRASSPSSAASGSAASEPAIARRLLTRSELPAGFSKHGDPSVSTSIGAWLERTQTSPAHRRAETARLRKLGFVAAATQALNSAQGPGLSLVEQFRSSAGARAEFMAQVLSFKLARAKTFPIPGIPGGLGIGFAPRGVNVAFRAGDYYYLIGEGVPDTTANQAAVNASAKKLYQRVHG